MELLMIEIIIIAIIVALNINRRGYWTCRITNVTSITLHWYTKTA